jgi:hypothetical protein
MVFLSNFRTLPPFFLSLTPIPFDLERYFDVFVSHVRSISKSCQLVVALEHSTSVGTKNCQVSLNML